MKVPCRKCESCGRWSDLSVTRCRCGADLTRAAAMLMDEVDLNQSNRGTVNVGLEFYVQKCSVCGTMNFTLDPNNRVCMCSNCHKRRIKDVAPVKYQEETPKKPEDIIQIQGSSAGEAEETESDEETAIWEELLDGFKLEMEGIPPVEETEAGGDDPEDMAGWEDLLGEPEPEKPVEIPPNRITFEALNFGTYRFAIQESEAASPIMLGRSALAGEFLEKDRRVSNDHCVIWFQNGIWYVKDNHSSNGTFLNGRDLGYNGQGALGSGAVLMLGHEKDSVSFRVTIT